MARERQESLIPGAIGLLGGLIALLVTSLRGVESTKFPDARPILEQAYGITEGWSFMQSHTLLQSNPLQLQFPWGLPAILAFTFFVSSSTSLFLFKVLLAVIHGFSVFLLARLGQQMQLKNIYWILAAIGFSLDPFILSSATDIQTESFTTLFVLCWAYMYLNWTVSTERVLLRIIIFPVTGFLAIVIRPNIILPFMLVAIFMLFAWHRNGIRNRVLITSIFVFVTLLIAFEIFLTRLYAGFVFLAPNGGLNSVLTCRPEFIPQYLGGASNAENLKINGWYSNYLQEMTSDILAKQQSLSIPSVNEELYRSGLSYCLENPVSSIGVLMLKIFALWRPFLVIGAYGMPLVILSAFLWVPMTVAAVVYLSNTKLSRVNRQLKVYFMLLALGFTLSLLPAATQIRHRVAFAEPFYWLFLAFLASEFFVKVVTYGKNMRVSKSR